MKKLLLTALVSASVFCFSQINMSPIQSHYNNSYPVTVSGSGTIYYTTDGTTPTLSSNSAVNSVQISINANKEIKAFLVNGSGVTSSVFSKKYYTGALPNSQIYFKPPSNWTNGACLITDMVNPNSVNGGVVDTFWPGSQMQNTGCDGWYKSTGYYENANLRFNNCFFMENIPGAVSTNMIPAGSIVYYDFTNGEISNPPGCLFLNTDEAKNQPVTLVKIYPNPVSDVLKINSDKDFKEYEILDISGKIISKKQLTSKEISLNELTSGNYFIRLKDQKENTILLKFIKK